ILVGRVDGLAEAGARLRLGGEAGALLGGVGQLAEGVRELEALGVELEALDEARVVGFSASQRAERRRPVEDEGRAAAADARLDALEEDLKEHVVPRRRAAEEHARGLGLGRQLARALVAREVDA